MVSSRCTVDATSVASTALPATPAHGSHERTIERRTQRPSDPRARPRGEGMVDSSNQVAFDDVKVIRDGLVLECRVGKRVVWVPARRMLHGTTIRRTGDLG